MSKMVLKGPLEVRGNEINDASFINGSLDNDLTFISKNKSIVLNSDKSTMDAIRIHSSNQTGGLDVETGSNGINMLSTGSIILKSDKPGVHSIKLLASDATGGINMKAGTNGIIGTTGGQFVMTSSFGIPSAVNINACNKSGGISINAGLGGIMLHTSGNVCLESDKLTLKANTIELVPRKDVIQTSDVTNTVTVHGISGIITMTKVELETMEYKIFKVKNNYVTSTSIIQLTLCERNEKGSGTPMISLKDVQSKMFIIGVTNIHPNDLLNGETLKIHYLILN